ncbi:MAG: 3-deoxy-D-manno-octulosonic acid transferase [Duncaniella sp.]|nr:3-deoxy-D-manno-octulosonic acid transferase [Duncaniella sp.]
MLGEYDMMMRVARDAVLAAAALVPDTSSAKLMRFGRGQRHIIDRIEAEAAGLDRSRPTVWVHCASLGEYGIARPVIALLRKRMVCNIVLTFFSPTGYEALRRRPSPDVDRVWYLPLDVHSNVTHFLDAVRPDCAAFMVSEYWHNYLHELRRRNIPAVLVSAIVREGSAFFKWYGGLYRESARCFSHVFALDEGTVTRLHRLGVEGVTLNGDPLFDNALLVASTPWHQPELERFAAGRGVFVAGSVHDDRDLDLVAGLANRNKDIPFIIVPHEIHEKTLAHIERKVEGKTLRLSQCDTQTDFEGIQAIIVDSVGSLAYLYRLGRWAYVGGGFTKLLHSVIEPVVYGLPVAFGPRIHRKVTPAQLMKLGIGRCVETPGAICSWFAQLRQNPEMLDTLRSRAAKYVNQNSGATSRVVDVIQREICAKN